MTRSLFKCTLQDRTTHDGSLSHSLNHYKRINADDGRHAFGGNESLLEDTEGHQEADQELRGGHGEEEIRAHRAGQRQTTSMGPGQHPKVSHMTALCRILSRD